METQLRDYVENQLLAYKEIIIQFRPGSGLNSQRIRTSDFGGTDYLELEPAGPILYVHFVRTMPGVNQRIKTLGWNFDVVAEFDCEVKV